MDCRRLAPLAFALALVACSASTSGLGDYGGESGSETAGTDGGSESSAGEGGSSDAGDTTGTSEATTDAPGDGDPSPICGDGIADAGEECDGDDLGGMDCAALGFAGGELSCSADCSLDSSACLDAVCGNGTIESPEACDGDDLGGMDCVALGFGVGTPSCTEACEYDTSGCPSPGEGDECGWGNECPFDNLSCVGGTCYDGSEGDPCTFNWECQDGLTCQGWDGMCLPP